MATDNISLSDTARADLQGLFKECSALFDGACTRLHQVIDSSDNNLSAEVLAELKTVAEQLARSAHPYDALQARLFNPDNDPRHAWHCISPGMYDSTYQRQRCGQKNVESIDNPATDNPVYGCQGND